MTRHTPKKYTGSKLRWHILYAIENRLGGVGVPRLDLRRWAAELLKEADEEDALIARLKVEDAAEAFRATQQAEPEICQYIEARLDWAVSRLVKGLQQRGFRPRAAGIRVLRRAIIDSRSKKAI